MSKEIKEEKSKAGVITTVVVAIAVIAGGIMLFKSNKADTTVQKPETVVATKAEPKEEKTIARIDLTAKLVDAEKPQFEVYVDSSENPEKQACWMPKFETQGYVVQSDNGNIDIVINAIKEDTDINLTLRGKWEQDEDKKMVENWVKYTSVSVNGKEILPEAVEVWHNKPFRYTINAKAGEEYKIHAEWTKADEVPEE
ncbi:MAG: hypothetical protein IJ677_05835 [Alphaproteobacteria bacterium]|nr:hypothetical protein [Alphaproteobacteria bacterium]